MSKIYLFGKIVHSFIVYQLASRSDLTVLLIECCVVSKPSTEVPAGRLSIPLQALTFSVADVLKDLDPLADENISTSKHDS